jgi:hypothetical protein
LLWGLRLRSAQATWPATAKNEPSFATLRPSSWPSWPVGPGQVGQPGAQVGDHRLEQPGIQAGVGVGERGPAGPLDLKAIAYPRALAGVVQAPQAAQGRVEESQQEQREEVVVMQDAVGVGAGLAQALAVLGEGREVLRADQRLIGVRPGGGGGGGGGLDRGILVHGPQQTRATIKAQVEFLLTLKVPDSIDESTKQIFNNVGQ